MKVGDRVVAVERGFALLPGDTGTVKDCEPFKTVCVLLDESGVEITYPFSKFHLQVNHDAWNLMREHKDFKGLLMEAGCGGEWDFWKALFSESEVEQDGAKVPLGLLVDQNLPRFRKP